MAEGETRPLTYCYIHTHHQYVIDTNDHNVFRRCAASPQVRGRGGLHGNVRYCRRATIPAVISHHRSVHVQHPSSRENEAPARMSISPPSVCGGTPKGVTITQVVLPGVRMVIKHLDRDQIAMICITPHPASGYSERHKALSGGNDGQFRGLRRMTHLMQHGQLGKRCISLVERRHWEIPPPLSLTFLLRRVARRSGFGLPSGLRVRSDR